VLRTLITSLISLAITPACICAQQERPDTSNDNWTPPSKICDRSGEHCVRLVSNRQPQATDGDCTLIISSKDKDLGRFSTYGYLLSAIWSPDGKYVAVNNRRANAGDYLWILSASDGRAIKVPEELASTHARGMMEIDHRKVMREIARCFPKCTEDTLRKSTLTARGWGSANQLRVREAFIFDAPGVLFVTVEEPYLITADKFEALPSLVVRRVRELTD
jgi:hypothetical protein